MNIYKSNIQWIYTYFNIDKWERIKEVEEGGGSKQRQCCGVCFLSFYFETNIKFVVLRV